MPIYPYACARGHETDRFFHMNDQRPKTVRCATCRRAARRIYTPPRVTADLAEHYNVGLDMPVRSRAHLRELQRASRDTAHPFQDYEPVKERSSDWKTRPRAFPSEALVDRAGLDDSGEPYVVPAD